MIEYIHVQLSIWGKAQMADARKGLGYASVCPMFQDARHGGSYGSRPPLGVTLTARENINDTDRAVARLDAPMRQLVVEMYLIRGTGDQVARRMGIARQRLYERLDVLHATMLGLLQDVVVDRLDAKPVDTIRTVSV
jgi:hypothetical protein